MLTRLNTILLTLIISTNFLLANEGPHDDCLTKGSSRQYVSGGFYQSLESIGSFVKGAAYRAVCFTQQNPVLVATLIASSISTLVDAQQEDRTYTYLCTSMYQWSHLRKASGPQPSDFYASSMLCPPLWENIHECLGLGNLIKHVQGSNTSVLDFTTSEGENCFLIIGGDLITKTSKCIGYFIQGKVCMLTLVPNTLMTDCQKNISGGLECLISEMYWNSKII